MVPISDHDLKELLRRRATELGFNLCGVVPAARPDTLEQFRDWLQLGFQGEMGYLQRREAAYENPSHVLPSVKTLIVLATCYEPPPSPNMRAAAPGRIAAYAQGSEDYHDVLRRKMKSLAVVLHEHRPQATTRGVVDTAPLLERDVARRAGLGWFGKNTMLINKRLGSYFFLCALLTNIELPADEPHLDSHCGTCTACLDACPTQAFPNPGQLDARRCLSYLTIELRGQPIPVEFRSQVQDWLFGCDICQQVCPWNRHAPHSAIPEFKPQDTLSAAEFLSLDEAEFRQRFRGTPLLRTGRDTLARTAAIVLGNQRDPVALSTLCQSLNDPAPVVRSAVVWALGNFAAADVQEILLLHQQQETDEMVLNELREVLEGISKPLM